MSIVIRPATIADGEQIRAIYRPYIDETVISFEYELPALEEIQRRIAYTLPERPWLVSERDGEIVGYVYAGQHSERKAYQWATDVSAYINADFHRKGLGRAMYTSLFALLKLQGFYNIYAGITLPNASSVGLHEAMGLVPVGVYEKVGYKFGKWHDVGWWQLHLQPLPDEPQPPVKFSELPQNDKWQAALEAGLPFIKL